MSKMTYENWMAHAEARRQRVRDEQVKSGRGELALPYVEAQETVRILGPALIRAGLDISIEEKRSMWNPDGPLSHAYRAWHRATSELHRHREAMNEEPSLHKQMGKHAIVERAKVRAWDWTPKIVTRPYLSFGVTTSDYFGSVTMRLTATMRLDPDTNKIVKPESSDFRWAEKKKSTCRFR